MFLTYLVTEITNREPELLDYAFVYWMLGFFDSEVGKLKSELKDILHEAQKDNYNLELEYTEKNLEEIGVADEMQPISLNYNEFKLDNKLDKLVDKTINQLSNKVKSQMMNALNTGNIRDVENILTTALKNEKKSYSTVSRLMRISRTENTQMRTRVKLDIQEELIKQGFKVKRRWLHTLYNPMAIVPDSYHPRQDHLEMHGQVEDDRGYFHCGGFITRGPGMFGVAKEDINCRCCVDFIIE